MHTINSRKYNINLTHTRHQPVKFAFSFKTFSFCLCLDELPLLDKALLFFKNNRFGLFAIYTKDYLGGRGKSIKENLFRRLEKIGPVRAINRVELITMPRCLGYSWNPINFYICYESASIISYIVAEVNNTYGERHLYILQSTKTGSSDFDAQTAKRFFVSPFNNVSGDYRFQVAIDQNSLQIIINLTDKSGNQVLTAGMVGASTPLTNWNLFKTFLSFPLTPFLTLPRIALQAIRLKIRGLKQLMKPNAEDVMTIKKVKSSRKRFF